MGPAGALIVSEVIGRFFHDDEETEQAGTDDGVEACFIPLKPDRTVADDGEIRLTAAPGLVVLHSRRDDEAGSTTVGF